MTSPAERALQIAQEARQREQQYRDDAPARREANRLAMPVSAAFVDAFTEIFGKLPRGWFTETGKDGVERTVEWGRKR